MKYRFLKENRSEFPIRKERLKNRINELYSEHNGMAGSPMITENLREDPEFSNISKNTVAKAMQEMNLRCRTQRKFVVTTNSKHNESVAPNLLNREFNTEEPNKAWVSDITYLKIGRTWYYLTVIIDLFSRFVTGWDLSDSLERFSAIRALNKAIMRRRPGNRLLFHSDQGIQFASKDFKKVLKKHGFVQSMSRRGDCWDNAVAESFFHTLKPNWSIM
nr:IS3 family transposase [Desulfobacula sp.]